MPIAAATTATAATTPGLAAVVAQDRMELARLRREGATVEIKGIVTMDAG